MSQEATEQSSTQKAWQATPDMAVLAVEQQARELYAEGRLNRARELVEKLVKMRPEVSQYWALLGVIHRRNDELVQALQCLQEAAELNPSNRNALVNLGESLVLAGKVPEGAEVLRAVFDMGYEEDKPPEDHDEFTKRAGAQLAIIQKVLEGVEAEA